MMATLQAAGLIFDRAVGTFARYPMRAVSLIAAAIFPAGVLTAILQTIGQGAVFDPLVAAAAPIALTAFAEEPQVTPRGLVLRPPSAIRFRRFEQKGALFVVFSSLIVAIYLLDRAAVAALTSLIVARAIQPFLVVFLGVGLGFFLRTAVLTVIAVEVAATWALESDGARVIDVVRSTPAKLFGRDAWKTTVALILALSFLLTLLQQAVTMIPALPIEGANWVYTLISALVFTTFWIFASIVVAISLARQTETL